MSEDNQPINSDKPKQMIDDMVAQLEATYRTLVEAATQVGHARDALLSIQPHWASLANANPADPEAARIYASGLNVLTAIRDETRARQGAVAPLGGLVKSIAGSIASLITATRTTASFSPDAYRTPSNHILVLEPDQHEEYAKRFAKLDPALGKTYREIWEALHGTRAEPERAAAYLILHAFDRLFEKLASNEEVHQSPFWDAKIEPGTEEQVWREERLRFAASRYVRDSVRANTLIASTKHMVDVYQGLNQAHERGELDPDKAQNALAETRSLLENWADAADI